MRVEVDIWNAHLGTLSDDTRSGIAAFEYASGYEGPSPSPFTLLKRPGLIFPTFALHGLHGAFYDSLPDAFGLAAMDRVFQKKGLNPERVTSLERLCYLGARAFGALSYRPDLGSKDHDVLVSIQEIALAKEVRETQEGRYDEVFPAFLKAASSPVGARPKLTIGVSRNDPDRVVIGDWASLAEYEPWILKVDVNPERAYGRIEHAFAVMARQAGLRTAETRILEDKHDGIARSHFAIKRFDREGTRRIHMHSLAALLERDFNRNETTYEELLSAAKRLTGNIAFAEEFLRRAIFNYAVGNCDDHAKNHAFLLREEGGWEPSPVYDLTPSRGEGHQNIHAMLIGVGFPEPTERNWCQLGETVGIPAEKTRQMIQAVYDAVMDWPSIATSCGITPQRAKEALDLEADAGREAPGWNQSY